MLLLGFIFGRLLRKVGVTEILGCLIAGVVIGPILHFNIPEKVISVITGITLAFVAYQVGLSFSFSFLKKRGKKILIILLTEAFATSIIVWAVVYLFTRKAALSVILASLAPATAPAGTIAVLREFRAKGILTEVSIAIVGLDDAVAIFIYSVGIVWTKALLGEGVNIMVSVIQPIREVFGAIVLGGVIGIIVSYISRKVSLLEDHIFVVFTAVAILSWGIAELLGVSAILTCMIFGTMVININEYIGKRSSKLMDNIMTPIFILFFVVIGLKIDFSKFASIWSVVIIYCVARSIGKIAGCSLGGVLARAERKVTKYLGIALLNQAGVAVGLAFLASQELSLHGLGNIIITLMATTTAVFQLLSPLGTQFAIKKAGEARI